MKNCGVFFLALDAAEPALLSRWMDDGSLPNLKLLRARSLHGAVQVPRGFGSDAIWPSVYTGVDPSRHGRYYHQQQNQAGSYRAGSKRRTDVMQKTVWEDMSTAGLRVAVIDLPKAPIAKNLNGIEILDWHSHFSYDYEFRTSPVALKQEVCAKFGDFSSCPCVTARYQNSDPRAALGVIEELKREVRDTVALLLDQLQSGPWDLFMAAFRTLHCAGHQLWHLHDTSHPWYAAAASPACDPLRDIYRMIDDAVGVLMGELHEDSAVLVFAGPGMGPGYVRHELLGDILVALDRGRPSAASALDKMLKSLWHRLPQDWRQPLSRLAHSTESRLQERDRSARPYYPVRTNDSVGGIRVNLRGREPAGLIDSDSLDKVCDELVRAIGEMRVTDTGEPLALDIFRTNTVYRGDYLDLLPDILIEWNHRSPITAVESSATGVIPQASLPEWSGTHTGRAMALIRPAGGQVGELPGNASVLDIAPTIAALCGMELAHCDGQVVYPLAL